jgi:hypothetical protein
MPKARAYIVLLAALLLALLLFVVVRHSERTASLEVQEIGVAVTASNAGALLIPIEAPAPEGPLRTAYLQQVASALLLEPPVLKLEGLDASAAQAQQIALAAPDFLSYVRADTAPAAGAQASAHRNQVFSVTPAREGDLHQQREYCAAHACYRVEMYNFSLNLGTTGIVDLDSKRLIEVRHRRGIQPDVPEALQQLALEIARATPEVALRIGRQPESGEFVMASTKTALNQTRCERSQHLCLAPTFVQGNRALWVIVDLTDLRVVGLQWTEWKDNPAGVVTEQRLRDDLITQELCERGTDFTQGDWTGRYVLTSSDGLLLENLSFRGQQLLRSAKNVDWHVSYSEKNGFGYSDAVGCPLFSAAAVVPAEFPKVKQFDFVDGTPLHELHQDYYSKWWPIPCNYYYEQRFQMLADGRLRLVLANVGRGCGEDGTYRPVQRFELPLEKTRVSRWHDGAWQAVETESWFLQPDEVSPEGYWFKFEDDQGRGMYLTPGRGQFGDKGRGDNAYLYLTRYHADRDEGQSDMPTIGPCCNSDHEQGPEKFIDQPPEAIKDQRIVIWYVPQLKNDGTPGREYCWASSELVDGKIEKREYPCVSGPLLTPFGWW